MDSFLSGRERLGDKPKPKSHDNPSLESEALAELEAPPAADAETTEACGEGGSKVEYLSEGGRVKRIVVTCACGQVTEIDCDYED